MTLRNLLPLVVAWVISGIAYADIGTSVKSKLHIHPIAASSKVFIRLVSVEKEVFESAFRNAGFVVVDDRDAADVVIMSLKNGVSVPSNSGASVVRISEIMSRAYPPVPPAIVGSLVTLPGGEGKTEGRGILDLDAAHFNSGAQLTGGNAGGVVVAALASLVVNSLNGASEDSKRIPGIAEIHIVVVPKEGNREGFTVYAAANTNENPRNLLAAALERAVNVVKYGFDPHARDQASSGEMQ